MGRGAVPRSLPSPAHGISLLSLIYNTFRATAPAAELGSEPARSGWWRCHSQPPDSMPTFRDVAQLFGEAIAAGDDAAAFELLTPEAQALYTPESLKAAVATMTAGSPGGIQEVQVMEEGIVEEWPEKQPGDVASVYVALTGAGFAEAVTVIIVQRNDNLLIRHLDWGRP